MKKDKLDPMIQRVLGIIRGKKAEREAKAMIVAPVKKKTVAKKAVAKKTTVKKTPVKSVKKVVAKKAPKKPTRLQRALSGLEAGMKKLAKAPKEPMTASKLSRTTISRQQLQKDLLVAKESGKKKFPGSKFSYFYDLDGSISMVIAYYKLPTVGPDSLWVVAKAKRNPFDDSDKLRGRSIAVGRLFEKVESLYDCLEVKRWPITRWPEVSRSLMTEEKMQKAWNRRVENTDIMHAARKVLAYARKYLGVKGYQRILMSYQIARETDKRMDDGRLKKMSSY